MIKLTTRNLVNLKGIGAISLIFAIAFAGFGQPVQANLFGGPEPLPVEQVFVPEILSVSEQTIAVEFSIVDGYYLYRDKLAFSAEDVIARAQNELPTSSQNGSQISTQTGGGTVDTLLANPIEAENVRLESPRFADAEVMEDDFFWQASDISQLYRHPHTLLIDRQCGEPYAWH